MAYEEIKTTQYRAKDGSLHSSIELAKKNDADRERYDRLFDIVSDAAWDMHHLSDFCGYNFIQKHGYENDYDRRQRVEEIMDVIRDKWDELKAVIEPQG